MPDQKLELPHEVRDIENVWITMSDGCRLAARIWLPDGAEAAPVPGILEYIPYRKRDATRRRDENMHPWFAANGYAALRVDMRGSGESEGILHDEYLRQEQDDALEVIAWIARQSWCSGQVGMMGKSWGAYNSLQVAARRPPALKAIIVVMGTDDRYAECIHYRGGALLNDNFWWGCTMQIFNARPPDPAIVGDRWREMWLERLQAERFWPEIWLRHQRLDEYWKHASVCFDYSSINCPTWFWGGWADWDRDTPFRLAEHLDAPLKVTVGPWAHLYPHEAIPKPTVEFRREALRWWDHWLKGKREDGLMQEPRLRFYMMDAAPPSSQTERRNGRWIAEENWPSLNVRTRELWLSPCRIQTQPTDEQALSVNSPQTTGLMCGDMASLGVPGDQPGDQSLDSSGSLEFDSVPLTERLEILGAASTLLELSVDRPVASVTVRLIDVAPDGRAALVARGFLNLAQRNSREEPLPVTPGARYSVKIQLAATAYAFALGHRIRVAISTAYWPILWPSPEPVTLTLFTGTSKLLLPVREPQHADLELPTFPEPPEANASALTVLRKGGVERSVSIDQLTGEMSHRLYLDGGVFGPQGKLRLDDIGMEMGHVCELTYKIHPSDPNSARARMVQTYEMGRGAWQVKIDTGAEMTSTATSFQLNAWVEAYEGEKSVFRREWNANIPRTQV